MNLSACPCLFNKLVETDDLNTIKCLSDTLTFLSVAKKYKVKKIGINSFLDSELAELHGGFPFGSNCSVFTTKQTYGIAKNPVIWKVCQEFSSLIGKNIGGCGNYMQHSMEHPLYTGIYSFNNEKCEYEFYKG